MKKTIFSILSLLVLSSLLLAAESNNSFANTTQTETAKATKKRGPVFRANKEQIKQAQSILKQRGFYGGEPTGKLDDDTRSGLRKYQSAETLKVTGTLNKVTLVKMGVELTDKQKLM